MISRWLLFWYTSLRFIPSTKNKQKDSNTLYLWLILTFSEAKFKANFIWILNCHQDGLWSGPFLDLPSSVTSRYILQRLIRTDLIATIFSLRLTIFQELQLPIFQGVAWFGGRWSLQLNFRCCITTALEGLIDRVWNTLVTMDDNTNCHSMPLNVLNPLQHDFLEY